MKYITDKSEISNYDAGFWDFLDSIDDEEIIQNDYSYLGLWYKGKLTEDKAKALLTEWGITCAYVMHYRGKSDSLWHSPLKPTCYHQALKKPQTYLDKYNLSKYRKIILLENFDEVVEFMVAMAPYPKIARYVNFYVICNNNLFLEIGHHDDIFVYQRNAPLSLKIRPFTLAQNNCDMIQAAGKVPCRIFANSLIMQSYSNIKAVIEWGMSG